MKLVVCAIRDNQSEYMRPSVYPKVELGIRDFKFWMNDKNGLQFANPGDFDFYKVGEYDTETAELIPCPVKLVIHGSEVIDHV